MREKVKKLTLILSKKQTGNKFESAKWFRQRSRKQKKPCQRQLYTMMIVMNTICKSTFDSSA